MFHAESENTLTLHDSTVSSFLVLRIPPVFVVTLLNAVLLFEF